MKLKVLTEAQKKNTYKIYYISKDTDLTTSAVVHAYSEKQAELVLRKVSNDVYHIIRIECIEDHSNDNNDGEQISLFEYSKEHSGQSYANKLTKDKFLNIANTINSKYVITPDLTVHHIDDTWYDGYKNNDLSNVMFINASKDQANALHQVLHFCKEYDKNIFGFIQSIIALIKMPIYFYDTNTNKIKKLNFYQAFKK